MILKLRNKKIIIDNTGTPELVSGVPIVFDYELGTNHYKTRLIVNGTIYRGNNFIVPLDYNTNTLSLTVELLDSRNIVMCTYKGAFSYLKLCLIGDSEIRNLYNEVARLTKENKELKEKGDVI